MKRYLKHDRHQLSAWEKENLWQAVQAEGRDEHAADRRRTGRPFRPALGLASAAAVLAVIAVWWIGTSDPNRGFGNAGEGVVTLPPVLEEPRTDGRDPAQVRGKAPAEEGAVALQMRMPEEKSVRSEDVVESLIVEAVEADQTAGDRENESVQETTVERDVPVGEVAEESVAAVAPVTTKAVAPAAVLASGRGQASKETFYVIHTIQGRVTDAATGKPLPLAVALIRGTSRTARADSTGRFEFIGVTPGESVILQVMAAGYKPSTQTVRIPESGSDELSFRLEKASAQDKDTLNDAAQEPVRMPVPRIGGLGRKGAVRSVEEALKKQTGVAMREGKAYVRSGRSGEVNMRIDPSRMAAPAWDETGGGGSVTGGTTPPNGEEVELMYFEHTGVNPFVATEEDALSTFAVDVDNASWTLARNYLRRGMLPPKDAIRVEEFVNAFDAGWPDQSTDAFRIHADGSPSRFGSGYHLLRVGLVGKTVADDRRKPANLVFVIDISGSMDRENRLGLVKQSLQVLLDELREGDSVGIVVYGSSGRVLLEPTDIGRREVIEDAIMRLGPGGSTNAYQGLKLAYEMARANYRADRVNRLILCSDGVANMGTSTEATEILEQVRRASDEGVTLSTIGFGMGNYNDVLMEKLADQGDGNYYYVDRRQEAERVFRENLTGLLQTIAREVKVQVEFDPGVVKRWRLLGYENRDVADRDFRNDAIDAGEVGSGHQVTALYEIKLSDRPAQKANLDFELFESDKDEPVRLGTVRLRHETPAHDTAGAGQVQEIEKPILLSNLTGDFATGSVWYRTQAVVTEFAEILRGSYWAKESRLADLVPLADGLAAELPGDEQVKELAELIRRAADLQDEDED